MVSSRKSSARSERRPQKKQLDERRREPRDPVPGDLWLIDCPATVVVHCRCTDVSDHGMGLRVPAGYGIGVGRSYELCSHLPGHASPPGQGLVISRRVRVTRATVLVDGHDEIELGVEFEAARTRRVPYRVVSEPPAHV